MTIWKPIDYEQFTKLHKYFTNETYQGPLVMTKQASIWSVE